MNTSPPSVPPFLVFAFEAGLAALYFGALIFIAGWSYADRYFAELGLNISAIDGIETTNFSAYAFWVFRDGTLVIAAVVAALLAAAFLFRRRIDVFSDQVLTAAAVVLALGSLIGAGYLGAARATHQAERLFSENHHNTVRVVLHAKPGTELKRYLDARPGLSKHGCLRKIFMDRKTLYAYAGYESQTGPNQQILIIPLSDVGLIETLPIRDLCRL